MGSFGRKKEIVKDLIKDKKSHWFKSLRINCWKINQVISKCQMEFLVKTCKKGLHIRLSLGVKFLFEQAILNFWTSYA